MGDFLKALWQQTVSQGANIWSSWRDPSRRATPEGPQRPTDWFELSRSVNSLMSEGRLAEATDLLEKVLDLSDEHYTDPTKLADWRAQVFEKAGDECLAEIQIVLTLVGFLAITFRVQDGRRLLAAVLNVDPTKLDEPERVAAAVAELTQLPSDPTFRVSFAMTTANLFGVTGETATGLRLLEQAAGIEKDDYAAPEALARRLRQDLDGVDFEVRTAWLTVLNALLLDQGRADDALALFAADLGATTELFDAAPSDLVQILQARLGRISSYGLGTYPRGLARTLSVGGRTEKAVAVLEAYAELDASCYEREEVLESRLQRLLDRTNRMTAVSFIHELIGLLKDSGQIDKASFLLRIYVDRFILADGQADSFDKSLVADFTSLFELWLELFGGEESPLPIMICRKLVNQIQRGFGSAPSLEDRKAFWRIIGSLRSRLMAVGHRQATATQDPEQRRRIFSELFIWDAELSQRLLLERFLMGERSVIPAGGLPQSGGEVAELLKPYIGRCRGTLSFDSAWLDELDFTPSVEPAGSDAPGTALLKQQADERSLASVLGSEALFLRAAFDPEGRLFWSLWSSDGRRLALQAHGSGKTTDLEDLRWAVARHDFTLGLLREQARRSSGPRRDFRNKAGTFEAEAEDLQNALRLLADTLGTEATASTEESRKLLDDFQSVFRPPSRQVADIFAGLMDHLKKNMEDFQKPPKDLRRQLLPNLCRPLFASRPDHPEKRRTWAALAAKRVQDFTALVGSLLGAGRPTTAALDAATQRFLDDAGQLAELHHLDLPPDRDLVLQVDELLHSVPLAFLPVNGRPLYGQVKSIRTTLGLLMDASQANLEETSAASPGRLLVLSHDQHDSEALPGMARLHLEMERIGKEQNCETLAASFQTPATAGVLRAALDVDPRFDVVTICGHGSSERAGVVLGAPDKQPKGELWQGAGCDLSGVDWLFLVSCSIGRVEQTGERDAEGFAVELALHGARSMAAFRWPVSSNEAPAFAAEAIERYLKSRRQGLTGPLRARALNDARRFFLDGAGESGQKASLHTIAACELYGLG